MRMIALIVFIVWVSITCLPVLLSVGIVGWNKTESWWAPVIDWCMDRTE